MEARADYDEVAWDRTDAASEECEKAFRRISTIRDLESIISSRLGDRARWVSPVHIGGYNVVYVMELESSKTSVAIRLPLPEHAQFPDEKTAPEAAVMSFLAQHTNVPVPTVLSHGKDPNIGPYIIMSFVENGGSMSRALALKSTEAADSHILDLDVEDSKLESYYFHAAQNLVRLFEPRFLRIESLSNPAEGFTVSGRPLTQNMNNMTQLGNIPKAVLPAEDQTYATADEWYVALSEMHMLQLAFQRNDLVKSADDCRNKFVARRLFLNLARAGRLSSFGFAEDTWSAQSDNTSATCPMPDKRGPFRLWCDDFRPSNILLSQSGDNVAALIDWEFAYVAPAQFALDPPWWLLLDVPEMWHLGMEDWCKTYERCLEVWLRAMGRAEEQAEEPQRGVCLQRYMRESWHMGRFWLNYAARKSWAFDSIFWQHLDERFFGRRPPGTKQEQLWQTRMDLLSYREKEAMEAVVSQKMEEMKTRVLVDWESADAAEHAAHVLFA